MNLPVLLSYTRLHSVVQAQLLFVSGVLTIIFALNAVSYDRFQTFGASCLNSLTALAVYVTILLKFDALPAIEHAFHRKWLLPLQYLGVFCGPLLLATGAMFRLGPPHPKRALAVGFSFAGMVSGLLFAFPVIYQLIHN